MTESPIQSALAVAALVIILALLALMSDTQAAWREAGGLSNADVGHAAAGRHNDELWEFWRIHAAEVEDDFYGGPAIGGGGAPPLPPKAKPLNFVRKAAG